MHPLVTMVLVLTILPTSLSTGRKVRVKCEPDDTIGDLKKLIAAQTGTRPEKLKLQKSHIVFRDHITIAYAPSPYTSFETSDYSAYHFAIV